MDFTDKFKNYGNSELLIILGNRNDYQPIAVEAAQAILESRRLSVEEIEIAKKEIEMQQQEKRDQSERKKAFEKKVKNIGASLIEDFNPVQKTPPTTQKTIRVLSIVFGLLSIYQFFKDFAIIKFMFSDSEAAWDFSMVLYFLPLIIVPTATVLFYFRQKAGWVLLTVFITYSLASLIVLFLIALLNLPSQISALDTIFPIPSIATYAGTMIFFGGTLFVLCKESIRAIYSIHKKAMFQVIISVGMLTAIIIYGLFR